MGLFAKNLAKCGQAITIQNRNITPPLFGDPDFDELYKDDKEIRGIISTERGKTIFDGVATDRPITHKICIEFLTGITAQSWVLLKGRRLDIVDVENCCEKDKVLILRCTERGIGEASKA